MAELPVFDGRTYEEHVSRWTELEQKEGMLKIEKGSVVYSLNRKYGNHGVERFAWEMGDNPKTLWHHMAVYKRLHDMEDSPRREILDCIENGTLKYTHVKEAHYRYERDDLMIDLLRDAQDGNWTTRRLLEQIATRNNVVAFTGAPGRNEHHEPHGITGFERPDTDIQYGDDDPFAGVPSSPVVEDLELRRLRASVLDICDMLESRDPDEQTIEQVHEMRLKLEDLERKLMEKKESPAGSREGEKESSAGVTAAG